MREEKRDVPQGVYLCLEDGRTFRAPLLAAGETTAVWAINHACVWKFEYVSRMNANDKEMKHKRLHTTFLWVVVFGVEDRVLPRGPNRGLDLERFCCGD